MINYYAVGAFTCSYISHKSSFLLQGIFLNLLDSLTLVLLGELFIFPGPSIHSVLVTFLTYYPFHRDR